MAIDKQMRARIDKLIEVYLNELESTTKAAGWHQPHVNQALIDFKGDLPERSGFDRSNDKAIREAEFIKNKHALLAPALHLLGIPHPCTKHGQAERRRDENGRLKLVVPKVCPHCGGMKIVMIRGRLPERYALPLLAVRFYRELNQDQVALTLGLSIKQLEGRLVKAREIAALELLSIDSYEEIKREVRQMAV